MIGINTALAVRAVLIVLVAAATACQGEPLDSDMGICQGPLTSPTPCGRDTCPAGQVCFVWHPGACAPPDLAEPPDGGVGGGGGGPNTCVEYQCVAPPPAFAACDCHSACDHYIGGSPNICSFDGATLNCVYS